MRSSTTELVCCSRPIAVYILGIGTGILIAFIIAPRPLWNIVTAVDEGAPESNPVLVSTVSSPLERRKCNLTEANLRNEEVRVLCWVMTNPNNHKNKAAAVNVTWGQHCTELLFISTTLDDQLPIVALNVKEGRNFLWDKTRGAFRHFVNNGYLEQVDWILKADDDTFVIMENLRSLLKRLNASKPLFLGLRLRNHNTEGFMSGGAGYVVSREAARNFVQALPSGHKKCLDRPYHFEDVAMAQCMSTLGVPFVDTRDEFGLERFNAYTPENQMAPDKKMDWMKKLAYFPLMPESLCCSSTAVSFHYVSPPAMRAIYYMIYKLKVYGRRECGDT